MRHGRLTGGAAGHAGGEGDGAGEFGAGAERCRDDLRGGGHGNPKEVINATKQSVPQMDVSGLPPYSKSGTRYTWSLGSLTLSGAGSQTVSTPVYRRT